MDWGTWVGGGRSEGAASGPSRSSHGSVVSPLHPHPGQLPAPTGHVILGGHASLPLGSGLWLVLPHPCVADPGHGHF